MKSAYLVRTAIVREVRKSACLIAGLTLIYIFAFFFRETIFDENQTDQQYGVPLGCSSETCRKAIFHIREQPPRLPVTDIIRKQTITLPKIPLVRRIAQPFLLDEAKWTVCRQNIKFLVIGTQKGGTSSFHSWIKQGLHPNVKVPLVGKELNLFSDKWSALEDKLGGSRHSYLPPGVFSSQTLLNWYFSQFSSKIIDQSGLCHVIEDQAFGEVSPNYLPYPFAPERAQKLLPGVKLVVMLRNPIDRAISGFNMKWQEKICGDNAWKLADCYKLNETTEENLRNDWIVSLRQTIHFEIDRIKSCYNDSEHPIRALFQCYQMSDLRSYELYQTLENDYHLGRSIYVDQIANWFQYFPTEQFLFISSDDLNEDPSHGITSFLDFIKVDPDKVSLQTAKTKHHVRKYVVEKIPEDILITLDAFFKPFNERLFHLLETRGHSYVVDKLKRFFAQNRQ